MSWLPALQFSCTQLYVVQQQHFFISGLLTQIFQVACQCHLSPLKEPIQKLKVN